MAETTAENGALRTRPSWQELPAALRERVSASIGGPCVGDRAAREGFSAGFAGRVRTTGGPVLVVFVKAIAADGHADSLGLYRAEAEALEALPPGIAPRLLAWIEIDEGVALVAEHLAGRQPGSPWTAAELDATAACLAELSATAAPPALMRASTAPSPGSAAAAGATPAPSRWRAIGADPDLRAGLPPRVRDALDDLVVMEVEALPGLSTGDALCHNDVRADNLVFDGEAARLVDWPWAASGAPWADLPMLLPSIEAAGGPACEDAWRVFSAHGAPAPREMLPMIAEAGAYFWSSQAQPEPAELRGLRAFQRAQARPALRWLDGLL